MQSEQGRPCRGSSTPPRRERRSTHTICLSQSSISALRLKSVPGRRIEARCNCVLGQPRKAEVSRTRSTPSTLLLLSAVWSLRYLPLAGEQSIDPVRLLHGVLVRERRTATIDGTVRRAIVATTTQHTPRLAGEMIDEDRMTKGTAKHEEGKTVAAGEVPLLPGHRWPTSESARSRQESWPIARGVGVALSTTSTCGRRRSDGMEMGHRGGIRGGVAGRRISRAGTIPTHPGGPTATGRESTLHPAAAVETTPSGQGTNLDGIDRGETDCKPVAITIPCSYFNGCLATLGCVAGQRTRYRALRDLYSGVRGTRREGKEA